MKTQRGIGLLLVALGAAAEASAFASTYDWLASGPPGLALAGRAAAAFGAAL